MDCKLIYEQKNMFTWSEATMSLGLQIKFLELFGEISEHLGRREWIKLLVLPLQVLYLPGRELMGGWEQSHLRRNKARL